MEVQCVSNFSCGEVVGEQHETESFPKQSKFKSICVFCGSSKGNKIIYENAAIELGEEFVCRHIDLVYGGGNLGLMGLVAKIVYHGGCHVLGVIPKTLANPDITGVSVGEIKVVNCMHEQKAVMGRNSDAFIALPGGYGTVEELFEVISWAKLGIHDKPIGLLNIDGYYDSLLSLIDKAVDEGFLSPTDKGIIVFAPTAKELIRKLEDYIPCYEKITSKESWKVKELDD